MSSTQLGNFSVSILKDDSESLDVAIDFSHLNAGQSTVRMNSKKEKDTSLKNGKDKVKRVRNKTKALNRAREKRDEEVARIKAKPKN